MASKFPPNTYDLTVKVRVTLPTGETPADQDIAMCLTGDDYDPWPGVQIHDMTLMGSEPVAHTEACTCHSEPMERDGKPGLRLIQCPVCAAKR